MEHHNLAFLTVIEYQFEKEHHKMQETCSNCSRRKNIAQPFAREKQVRMSAEM